MFEAIVSCNGWDDVTAALQLLSHLDGDALNVALLVPAPRRVLPGGLVDAMTEHYSSPGRLADYRRPFERVSRVPGTDPSIFAVELETLAMRAFGDLSQLARLRLVRDRFIVGQASCVAPETPTRDIVDRCRVWESHAEFMDHRGDSPIPRQPLPVYAIDNGGTGNGPTGVTADITPEDQELLGLLMRHLLPTPVVLPPKATPIPSECDLLIQRLMGNYHPVQPLPKERSSFTDMEILLQNLLLVGSPVTEHSRPTERQNRSTVVCFSCGDSGHAASRCPTLDETFPFLPMGWRADRVGDGFVMRSPTVETAVCCAWLDDFDWVVPDRVPDILESGRTTEEYLSDLRHVEEVLPDVFPVVFYLPTVAEVSSAVFAEEAAPVVAPLAEVETVIVGMVGLIKAGSELPVKSLNSEHVTQDCWCVDVGVVVPELSPVVSARAAAVPMSLPAIAEVVSSAVFAGGLLLMQPL